MKSPRVLQVFNRYLEYGGEERVVQALPDWLQGACEVETCWFDSAEWKGANAPPLWKQPFMMIRNPAAIERLKKAHEKFRPDVWLLSNVFPVASAAVYQAALECRVPAIHYIHNFRPFSVGAGLWANGRIVQAGLQKNLWPEVCAGAWQNSVLKSACMAFALNTLQRKGWLKSVKAWIAISDFMRDRFIEGGIPASDVFTLRHPFSATLPYEEKQGDYFLYLGRLHETKGVLTLLEAWRILRNHPPGKSLKLVIGGTGPLQDLVRQAAAENPSIEYRGLLSDAEKNEAIRSCCAMLAPSVWWEPLGLVTYEAYDYGKPMLAARSGGLTETVEDGVTGILHEPGNAQELAQQMIAVSENRDRAVEMGRAGRRWLLANTGEVAWVDRFMEIVQHAMKK